ncbi:14661_t:CDS:1 [Gigaspora margarita]|uniref:14661_t:CDS:1 n=1 Tax=Gigaspora margarita TaxID=4874 RepID=A0ABN7WDY7_GIGMA|nr:14661_t:CDS:1 [Gigaspora margarita]
MSRNFPTLECINEYESNEEWLQRIGSISQSSQTVNKQVDEVMDESFEKTYESKDATGYLKNHLIKDSKSNRKFLDKRFNSDWNILKSYYFSKLKYDKVVKKGL